MSAGDRARTPWFLLIALLATVAYAAFSSGATQLPEESWVQLALLLLAVIATGAWVYGGGVRPAASPLAWAGVILLAAFTVWIGVTILWSVAPDRSWIALNRGIAYLVCTLLALAVGASMPRAPERVARGLAILAVPVALYALGGKTLPGVSIGGILNLDHAGTLTRLRAPFGYWNALALFCVIGAFPMLRLAADPARRAFGRLAALGGVYLLVIILGMTYSRGGVLAFVVGTLVFLAFTTERVRALVLLALAMFFATVPLTLALLSPDLVTNTLPVERREDDGLRVLIAFLVALALLLAVGRLVIALERGRVFTPERGKRVGRAAAAIAAVLFAIGTVSFVAGGGLAATADRFTDTTAADGLTDPTRLLSTNSGNRWTWWKEAVGAWDDEPLRGWGAGSFPVTHNRYRTQLLPVQQPHSVPLQFLAETGIVGAVLGLAGLLALIIAAVLRVHRMPWRVSGAPPGRGYAAALLAAPVAWIVHSLYDWDWDIPAVTLPMLIALGAVAARPAAPRPVLPRREGEGGLRALGFATGVMALLLAMLSAALPALAETRTAAALEAVGSERLTEQQLADAAADAEFAAKLNPLAVEPLFAAASIAERRGRLDEARRQILRALERQPDNVDGWFRLTRLEFSRLDRAGVRRAAQRALELDPLNPVAFALARRAHQAAILPGESATATGSPIPRQVPITEPDPVPSPGAQPFPTPAPSPVPPLSGAAPTPTPGPAAGAHG